MYWEDGALGSKDGSQLCVSVSYLPAQEAGCSEKAEKVLTMLASIMEWLIASGYICDEDKEVVWYGLEQGMHSIAGILVTFAVGYLLDVPAESAVFLAAFIPLRMYIGGYHANTRKRCAALSALIMLASLSWIRSWNLSRGQTLSLVIFECAVLFFIIPVDGPLRLEEIERKVYRRKGRIILIMELLLFVGTEQWLNGLFSKSLAAVFSAAFGLAIAGMIKNKAFGTI